MAASSEGAFIGFACPQCQTQIEATPDLVGAAAECPACGHKIVVPDPSAGGVLRHSAEEDKSRTQMLKSRTIRIELGDL